MTITVKPIDATTPINEYGIYISKYTVKHRISKVMTTKTGGVVYSPIRETSIRNRIAREAKTKLANIVSIEIQLIKQIGTANDAFEETESEKNEIVNE